MQDLFLKNKKLMQVRLGLIVKKLRKQTNKSISLLTAEVGMTKSLLADTEKGIKDPQLSTLWRIAQGLNIPLSEIIKLLETELEENFTLIE